MPFGCILFPRLEDVPQNADDGGGSDGGDHGDHGDHGDDGDHGDHGDHGNQNRPVLTRSVAPLQS